ncbi:MAG: zinc ribbon domain-containing protein [Bacteroidota bacterium]
MPTYDYRCKSCGFKFEEFQSMSSEKLVICPKCAEPSLKRMMSSGAGLVFKGSGFYQTDYKKSNSSPSSLSAKSESKTESKPKTKPESGPISESQLKSESKPESEPQSKSESKSESKSKPDSKPSTDSSSGTDK